MSVPSVPACRGVPFQQGSTRNPVLCTCGACNICGIQAAAAGVYTPVNVPAKSSKPVASHAPATPPAPPPDAPPRAAPAPGRSPYRPIDPAIPLTTRFLFVSKRLDLRDLPREPVYSAPVILFGDVPHYRVTPAVFDWVEGAITDSLEPRRLAGEATQAEVDEALAVYDRLCEYANAVFVPEALREARAKRPDLPPVPWVPAS